MLYECNVLRMKILKYGLLLSAMIMLLIVIPYAILTVETDWYDLVLLLLILSLLDLILFVFFFKYTSKLKYVAIGRIRLIVEEDGQEIEYSWLDVEQITLYRFWKIYKLKLKEKEEIYFTPYGVVTLLTGDESDMGVIINKMKRELSI